MLERFLKEEVQKTGFKKAVIGLSGGVDSSLVAYLCAESLGKKNVHGILLPYRSSSPESVRDATAVVKALKINSQLIDISSMVDAYFEKMPDMTDLRRGNKMARERMSVLYDLSQKLGALVIGTSNKTELLLGYGTQHGDLASAINPLGDLYKTQVWALAAYLKVPAPIVQKPPSADLWIGQTDEAELGFGYREVDKLLYALIDRRAKMEDLLEQGFDKGFVEKVYKKIKDTQYKRRLPLIAKISRRTIDRDFRYARDWGK